MIAWRAKNTSPLLNQDLEGVIELITQPGLRFALGLVKSMIKKLRFVTQCFFFNILLANK